MATRTATPEVEVDEPRIDVVEHERGETRRLVKILAKKWVPAWALLLAFQNVVTLPSWWGFAAPVLDVLGFKVGA